MPCRTVTPDSEGDVEDQRWEAMREKQYDLIRLHEGMKPEELVTAGKQLSDQLRKISTNRTRLLATKWDELGAEGGQKWARDNAFKPDEWTSKEHNLLKDISLLEDELLKREKGYKLIHSFDSSVGQDEKEIHIKQRVEHMLNQYNPLKY